MKLEKKSEKGNSWFEISLFWDIIQFLVTDNYSGGAVISFLRSALKSLEPLNIRTNTKTTTILVREEGTTITQTAQRLGQYKKKWLFRSSRFVQKGFCTTVPLEVHCNSAKINMALVASFLLSTGWLFFCSCASVADVCVTEGRDLCVQTASFYCFGFYHVWSYWIQQGRLFPYIFISS